MARDSWNIDESIEDSDWPKRTDDSLAALSLKRAAKRQLSPRDPGVLPPKQTPEEEEEEE